MICRRGGSGHRIRRAETPPLTLALADVDVAAPLAMMCSTGISLGRNEPMKTANRIMVQATCLVIGRTDPVVATFGHAWPASRMTLRDACRADVAQQLNVGAGDVVVLSDLRIVASMEA